MWRTTSSLGLYLLAFANFLGCRTSPTLSTTLPGKLRFVLPLDLEMAGKTVLLGRRIKDQLKNARRMMQNHTTVRNLNVILLSLRLLQQNQGQNQRQNQHQNHLFIANHHHLVGSLRVRIISDLHRHLYRLLYLHHHHQLTKSLLRLALHLLLLLPHHLFTKSPQRIDIEVHHPLLMKFLL